MAGGEGSPGTSSRRSIPNTSGRRTPTCCWPRSTGDCPIPPPSTTVLEELAARDGDASAGLPAADGAGRGGRGLARRGEERAPAPGRQSADSRAAPPARPRRRAARPARRGRSPPTAHWPCSTRPTRPRCITAWPSCCARRASRRRPAARCSSRSRRPRGSSTRTGSCSSWSSPSTAATPGTHPADRPPTIDGGRRHDAKTPDPGRV